MKTLETKEKIISLDGIDKTGKDYIKDKLIQESNGNILIWLRSFISQIAYSRIYNRNINEKYFINQMKLYSSMGMIFFYITSSPELIKERILKFNEQDITISDIEHHLSIFNQVLWTLREINNIPIYIIDNNNTSQPITQILSIIENS